MKATLSLNGIWQSKKNGKKFKLVGINKENHKVQLCSIDDNDVNEYNIMSKTSLLKNYSIIATSKNKLSTIETNHIPNPSTETKEAKQFNKKRQPGRIKLSDEKVITGKDFLHNTAQENEANTCKTHSIIWWLTNAEKGRALLAKFNAKVVYGESLTK